MIFLAVVVIVLLFGFVVLFGAPYLPTRRQQTQAALDLADLKPGQTLYELGCGDGRVLKQAAECGYNAVGYELNPLLVLFAKAYTWKYRSQIHVVWGNMWRADLSKADAVFVFLLDKYMLKLDAKMKKQARKQVKLVSFAFKIPGRKIAAEKDGIFLYQY